MHTPALRLASIALFVSAALPALSCSSGPEACADDDIACQLNIAPVCETSSSAWSPGTPIFEDVSARAGTEAMGAIGTRISVADVNHDGLPDILARRPGGASDDFSEEGTRHTWLLINQGDGTFEDTTESSGLLTSRDPSDPPRPVETVAFGDVNNDGFLDVVTAFTNTAPLSSQGAEVMLGDGQGGFEIGPVSLALQQAGELAVRGGLSLTDIDRDGNLDLWIANGAAGANGPQQDQLLKGDGQGAFTDITAEAGLSTEPWTLGALNEARAHSNAWSGAACDLNNDGTPELLAASYGRAPNHLWLGASTGGEVSFTNHAIASGYAFDDRTDWSDNESARCFCKLNRSAEDCAEVPEPRVRCESEADILRWNHAHDRNPFRLGGNSGTTLCADLNNDGRLDLLTTEIVHWDVGSSSDPSEILYNTAGDTLTFERPGPEATGLDRPRETTFDDGDITAATLDFDNDGRLDILIASTDYPGTRAHLYHQQPDATFARVSPEDGIDLTSAHGVATADFNRDGALDLVIGHSQNRCSSGDHCQESAHVRVFENKLPPNNWLQIQLEGAPGINADAIGAQITVDTPELTRLAEVQGGHGHYGMQNDLTQHFGLGNHCQAEVTVRWPDANLTTETYTLPAGYRFVLSPGAPPRVAP
ncbi:CRTAC1 family protein [Lujinxingia vulgaris]|uniref:CRTAC1 family protein n=1 Tax=Lujinxingia vulgaris TaxID=2600176 RepID=A0A5C6XD95_9DELT|nr:CRTAC1 family protein [Lujinxingia vulgaris]TXD36072.1 CRTAC1 family protein [Lujinxingia vulgaris]